MDNVYVETIRSPDEMDDDLERETVLWGLKGEDK